MKSLKEYSLNLSEEDYHNYPAWSYSMIAKYAKDGFSAISTLHERTAPTPSMEFGSLFDSIITKGKKTLDTYVIDNTACPPAEKEVFDRLLATGHTEAYIDIQPSDLTSVMESCESFCSKYKKYDTRIAKLDAASGYYDARRTGKKVVSSQDWEDAMEMARPFRTDEYLKSIFGTKNTQDIEYIYQAQFKTTWVIEGEEVDVKIMPDLLIVNHKDRTIQPVDLKTSSVQAYNFVENFLNFKYYLQAECYTDILRKICEEDEDYRYYTILPFLFTDISRTDKIPVTYEYDPSTSFSYTKGDRTYSYKGWQELLAEILVYEAEQAKVPSYITLAGPNNIIDILSR